MIKALSVVLVLSCLMACGQVNDVQDDHAIKESRDPLLTWRMDTLVAGIAAENRVDHHAVGYGGVRTAQYDRYVSLSEWPIEDLRLLTRHPNLAVRCYAGWALAEKDHPGLDTVFAEFLQEQELVSVSSGCMSSGEALASELYHAYWRRLYWRGQTFPEERVLDTPLLFRMDSIILYSGTSQWLLLDRALGYRVYPVPFTDRIAYLAFRENNLDAIHYIFRNARERFSDELRSALSGQLQKEKLWPHKYLELATLILAHGDAELKDELLKHMKTNDIWKSSKVDFRVLFKEYGVALPV